MDKSTTHEDRSAGRRCQRPGFFGRFARDRKGNVAIEFAALALPFAMLVFAILESCISFAAQQMISNVADDVARQYRTGERKAADLNKDELEELICGRLSIIVSGGCLANLEVDLRRYDSFAEAAKLRIPYKDEDLDTSGFKVEPGLSTSKNVLRVFYRWPIITDFLRKSMSNLPDGKTLLYAMVTWQNEPFDD